ncbi:hypothetical protein HMI54_006892, partial [Coelomomyces lativittatus]
MSSSPTDQEPLLDSLNKSHIGSPDRKFSTSSSLSPTEDPSSSFNSSSYYDESLKLQRRASQISKNIYTPLGIRKLGDLGLIPTEDSILEPKLPTPKKRASVFKSAENISSEEHRAPSMVLPMKLPNNFGSHFFSANHLNEEKMSSLTTRKKKVYSQLSVLFGFILLTFVLYDYIALLVYEQESVLRPWLMSIQ